MRMWMVDPKFLCRQHLLGEHAELHKHLPSLRKGINVNGRFNPVVQIQFQGYEQRHQILVDEMAARGYNHKSPLLDIPDFESIYPDYWDLKVDENISIEDLKCRCEKCKRRIEDGNC